MKIVFSIWNQYWFQFLGGANCSFHCGYLSQHQGPRFSEKFAGPKNTLWHFYPLILWSWFKILPARKTLLDSCARLFLKLVFPYVVKGIKIKISAKFRASRHLVLKIRRELCHPKYARKVSGLSRNRPKGFVVEKAEHGPGHMVLSTVSLVLKVVSSTADKSRQT